MLDSLMTWLMLEGSPQHYLWFFYVTFHDFFQWIIVSIIGVTAWGQRKHKKALQELVSEIQKELAHVHAEVHFHIQEDSRRHEALGQSSLISLEKKINYPNSENRS